MDSPAPVNYALDQHGAVYHVAEALEGAAGAALSIPELADSYKCPMPSDLFRVKKHNKLATDKEAEEWLVRRAIAFLAKWLVIENDTIRFKDGVGFDDLRFHDKPIPRSGPDPYKLLRDPFDPMKGKFSDNIRIDLGDMTELRESMKAYGWIDKPQFRALGDKRGEEVILIGHRRIAVAKELGIDWRKHIDWLELGEGDAADAERFKLAIASNLGAKPLSPNDRKRIAEHLYGEKDWTIERIAKALDAGKSTISRDLAEFPTVGKSKRGRPRVKAEKKPEPTAHLQKAQKAIKELRDELGRDPTYKEIGQKAGVSATPVRLAVALDKFGAVATEAPEPDPASADGRKNDEAIDVAGPPRLCPTCGQPWPHATTEEKAP